MLKPIVYFVLTLLSTLSLSQFAIAEDIPGHALLSKPNGDALVIWDASRVVATIVRSKMSDREANDLLERDAARVLANMLPNIERTARTVTVRVVYFKSGDVSPVYGSPTFKGVERYATLTLGGTDAKADKGKWQELDSQAALPPWFLYKVSGRLPPRL